MVPSDYVQVADFPKNPSGKIDRNGLQEFYLTQKNHKKNKPKENLRLICMG